MRLLAVLLSASFLSACTAARVEKMSFHEALSDLRASKVERKAARRVATPPPAQAALESVATSSPELQAALVGFAARARSLRNSSARGARMPAGQIENWEELVEKVALFLERRPEQTSSFDLVRARITLEAELELDARAYGDFPPELAERVLDRVTRVGVRMAEVRRLGVKPREIETTYDWPVSPVAVTSLFGKRLHPIHRSYKLHMGLDLAASEGQRVLAAGSGTVVRADWNGAHGLQVELQHAGGVVTRYSHLSELLVEPGTLVKKGATLGLAGSTGASTGPHLHFEFWRGGKPMDPLDELQEPADRSLPMASM